MDFLIETMCDNCCTVAKVNVKTKELYFYKQESEIWPTKEIPETIDLYCRGLLASGLIFEEDMWQLEQLFDLNRIVIHCQEERRTKNLNFRVRLDDKLSWFRLVLMVPKPYSEENPFVLLYCYQLNMNESDFYDENYVLSGYIYSIVKANLTTNEFAVIKEPTSGMFRREHLRRGIFADNISCENFDQIHPDDLEMFKKNMNREAVERYFEEGNNSYYIYYRRKIGNIYRWVKIVVLPGEKDTEKGQTYYFYVMDVHKAVQEIIDQDAKLQIASVYALNSKDASKIYYENLMSLLSNFTQPYIDYGILDLRQGYYIRYKVRGAGIAEAVPAIAKYVDVMANMEKMVADSESVEILKAYDTPEKIRDLLKNQVTSEYTCKSRNGKRYRVVMQKKQAIKDAPTKVILYTQEAPDEKRLKIVTFGNFQVYNEENQPVKFKRKRSKEVLAYLIDRQGYPVTSKELVECVLEKNGADMSAVKYVSTLIRGAMNDLKEAGFDDVIVKEAQSVRVNKDKVDCDYYHLLDGNTFYWTNYKNEYMKEYSWAEETNGEIMTWTV